MKLTRRKWLQTMMKTILVALPTSLTYSYFWETTQLTVKQERFRHPRWPANLNGLKLLLISDTHFGFHYDVNLFQSVVDVAYAERPDVILFLGDLFDRHLHETVAEDVTHALAKLPNVPKFAIAGNHDYANISAFDTMMKAANFTVLRNDTALFRNQLRFIGLDDCLHGTPDASLCFHDDGHFPILLVHEPDFPLLVPDHPIPLQLSGHSHGGQVRVPFIGSIFTPVLAKQYISGFYSLDHDRFVYVGRGLGTTGLPFRFCCLPEVTVMTCERQKSD